MSILKKIHSLFTYTRKEADNKAAMQEEIAASSIVTSVSKENVINVYSHGFTNGVHRIEPDADTFGKFLLANSEQEKIDLLRAANNQNLREARQKLAAEATVHKQAEEIAIEKERQAENTGNRITEAQQVKFQKQEKRRALIEQRNNTKPEYSWVPALLYLVAGIVFIVSDVSITQQITSWGFDMKGTEGWIFAIGLAFTAFLIKPLIDRILEKPFQKNGFDLKKLYKFVLLGITILGITMLFLLGRFRSDSQTADTRFRENKSQVEDLRNRMGPDYVNSQEYKTLQTDRSSINKALADSPNGQMGIVLSGIIFAIGGALCMAVAFPSLSQLINRYWLLPIRIQRIISSILKSNQQLELLGNELAEINWERDKAAARLKSTGMTVLRDNIKIMEEEQRSLIEQYYEIQYRKEISLYSDGKNRGEKYSAEGELSYKVAENDPSDLYDQGGNGKNVSNRSYTRRPFVKIRKMIADNYNNNQYNNSKDGTEFEIVS